MKTFSISRPSCARRAERTQLSSLVQNAEQQIRFAPSRRLHTLSPRGSREIYENALLMIETQQGDDPAVQRICEAARELIEARLRPE
jgi:hypothetical protein